MDVLKPDVYWEDGICYRLNPLVISEPSEEKKQSHEEYDDSDASECTEDDVFEDFDLEVTEGGRYITKFHIARSYYSYIIGYKGGILHRLEAETGTQIRIPRQTQNSDIIITGEKAKGVSAARRRIHLIVMAARDRQPFTHFLSIAFTSSSIKSRFLEFKENVLETCKSDGIEPSIFQSPDKLHLTLGTMTLADNEERMQGSAALEECKTEVIDAYLKTGPLKIRMIGVEYMNDDPAEVDVLYGKIDVEEDRSDILQVLSDEIVRFFTSKGLMKKQNEHVKLHVTLMNTLFRDDKPSSRDEPKPYNHKGKPRHTFDAREILEKFKDFDFGTQILESVHLSQRYTTGQDGYYKATAVVKLI